MAQSTYLASLSAQDREDLERRLHERQMGRCFLCREPINLDLHKGQIELDHIDPLAADGLDAESNLALTHRPCNRKKGSSNLEVARRLIEFEGLQTKAHDAGERGANLDDVLRNHQGAIHAVAVQVADTQVQFSFSELGQPSIQTAPLLSDPLSGMRSFFASVPLEYLHHDDRINPRAIGVNIRRLLEEFQAKRPQLHVALGWWSPDQDGRGQIKVFDGQHKAAAQILLGVRQLPIRVFVEPDTNVLLQANTNAGGKLRQVAFDAAVMRHLGGTLYKERVRQYQDLHELAEAETPFSEQDLVHFYRGEKREMERYIIDEQRDQIVSNTDNRIREFIEWSGKGTTRPLSYSAIESSFFREFLYKKALATRLDHGMARGTNPRLNEQKQLVEIMSIFADVFFVDQWDPETGGNRLEFRIAKGEKVPTGHIRAWRVARVEVLANIVRWLRLAIEYYYAANGRMYDSRRLLHEPLPSQCWLNLRAFLHSVKHLQCWSDTTLSNIVFGPKQNLGYWREVFQTGRAPGLGPDQPGPSITAPFELARMITEGRVYAERES